MKRVFFLLLLFASLGVRSQVMNKAEYFIDIDPGIGNGVDIPIGTNALTVSFTASIPTSGLSEGFHNLGIRTRLDNGIWSHYENRVFYLSKFASIATNVKSAEFFIDTDPGNGNGTPITGVPMGATTSFVTAVPTTGLANGFHNLIIRAQNELGQWGIGENRVFYTSSTADVPNIVAAEFFIDSDPGAGSATALSVGAIGANTTFTASISTTGITNGFHNLYIRSKNAQGLWSHFENRVFYVSNQGLPAADITAMEYFIDNDPGVGKGVAVAITTGSVVTLIADIETTGLTTGKHFLHLRAKSADGWGNFDSQEFTIGAAVAPAKPVIASIDGKTTSPVLTSVDKPIIKGTSSANLTIEVFSDATSLGTVIADPTGNWTFTPTTALADGTYNITTTAKNASNLTSVPSDVFIVTIDTQAPAIATIVSIDAKTAQNFTTANNKPVIVGRAEVAATVELFNGAAKLGETIADASGNYSFIPTAALADGVYVITASAKDAAGNVGVKSASFSFSILTLIPSAPVIASVDGRLIQNFVTNVNQPVVLGTATVGSTIEIFNGAANLGTTTATSGGNFTFTPASTLPDGDYVLTAKAKNSANVLSAASNSFAFRIDTQAPLAPVVVSVVTRTAQNFSTSNQLPVIAGTGEPGAVIEIFNGTTSLGFVTVGADGKFSFTPSSPLADGNIQITARAKDAAGNTSQSSATFNFKVDTQVPSPPSIAIVDNKTIQNFTTTNNKPEIKGVAEPGSTVEIFNGTTSLGFAIADANGNYIFVPLNALADGSYNLSAKTKDAAGNTSVSSLNYTFMIDATAPPAPIIASVDGKTTTSFTTANSRPIVLGTTEIAAVLELFNGTVSFGFATVNASGGFTFTPASALPDGNYSLTAKAKDAAGNQSPASNIFSFTVDTKNPSAPVIASIDGKLSSPVSSNDAQPTLLGTAEPAAVLTLSANSNIIGTATADATGSWSFKMGTDLSVGLYNFTAVAADVAGNKSLVSNVMVYELLPLNVELSANNVLTPNGDGKNDYLVVQNLKYYPGNTIKVIDRGGRIIYQATNYQNNWDGSLNGTSLAEGTYYYIIDKGAAFQPFRSFITIIRKSIR